MKKDQIFVITSAVSRSVGDVISENHKISYKDLNATIFVYVLFFTTHRSRVQQQLNRRKSSLRLNVSQLAMVAPYGYITKQPFVCRLYISFRFGIVLFYITEYRHYVVIIVYTQQTL